MKDFQFNRAASVLEAIEAKGEGARFVAGGTNLIDLMKYGAEQPDTLIDITRLPLTKVETTSGGSLRVGALVSNSDLAAHSAVVQSYPVLAEALLSGASPQLRNMATVGGNLLQRTRCHYFMDPAFPCNKRAPGSGCPAIQGQNRIHAILGASPSCIAVHPSDMAVALSALDAVVHVQGPGGERDIAIDDFHRLPGDTPQTETTLKQGELITWIDLPVMPNGSVSHYLKVRDRAEYQFALVSVAAMLQVQDGKVSAARIVLGGVAHKPWRAKEAEASLVGQTLGPATYGQAAMIALKDAKGFGHNDFKVELAKRSIVRALADTEGKLR